MRQIHSTQINQYAGRNTKLYYLSLDNSDVHVLLVSLFGIPIVWSISHFFGRPNFFFGIPIFFLVYQIFSWSTKKMRYWPENWYTKETDQKYMDAAKFMNQLKQAQISTYGRSMTTLYYCSLNHQSGFQNYHIFFNTVRPRDTRPQVARTFQVHVFQLGQK